ncbi:hypothetical protein I3843_08G148800 [Carya illinoinensis]|nr:hypothetical protein I3843_08G148800 [Carya illinoinensis]
MLSRKEQLKEKAPKAWHVDGLESALMEKLLGRCINTLGNYYLLDSVLIDF